MDRLKKERYQKEEVEREERNWGKEDDEIKMKREYHIEFWRKKGIIKEKYMRRTVKGKIKKKEKRKDI